MPESDWDPHDRDTLPTLIAAVDRLEKENAELRVNNETLNLERERDQLRAELPVRVQLDEDSEREADLLEERDQLRAERDQLRAELVKADAERFALQAACQDAEAKNKRLQYEYEFANRWAGEYRRVADHCRTLLATGVTWMEKFSRYANWEEHCDWEHSCNGDPKEVDEDGCWLNECEGGCPLECCGGCDAETPEGCGTHKPDCGLIGWVKRARNLMSDLVPTEVQDG